MGTTYISAWHSPKNYAEEKEEILKICEPFKVEQASKVGGHWYVAVRSLDGKDVSAIVFKISRHKGEWGYKDMCESVGPNLDRAPASLIKKLTPTNSEWANEWRARCLANAKSEKTAKAKTAVLKNGETYNCAGLFGKVNGKDLTKMQAHSVEARKFWAPEVGILYTLKKNQMKKLAAMN